MDKSHSSFNYLDLYGPCGEYLTARSGELFSQVLYIHLTWLAGSLGDLFFQLEILLRAQTLLLSQSVVFPWIGYGKGIFFALPRKDERDMAPLGIGL